MDPFRHARWTCCGLGLADGCTVHEVLVPNSRICREEPPCLSRVRNSLPTRPHPSPTTGIGGGKDWPWAEEEVQVLDTQWIRSQFQWKVKIWWRHCSHSRYSVPPWSKWPLPLFSFPSFHADIRQDGGCKSQAIASVWTHVSPLYFFISSEVFEFPVL